MTHCTHSSKITSRTLTILVLPFLCLISISGGCNKSDGLNRFSVRGTITFQGNPIPKGFIQFIPDTASGNSGPGGGAEIINGEYSAPSDKGIVGGKYIIRIRGTDGVATKEGGEEIPEGKSLFRPVELQHDFPSEDSVWNYEVVAQ